MSDTDTSKPRLSLGWTYKGRQHSVGIGGVLVVLILAGAVGAIFGRVLPPFVVDGNWWGSFFASAGFGGVAAVGAATIAFRAAKDSSRRASETALKDRGQRDAADQRSQWWNRFTWATDRAINEDTSELGVSVLLKLVDQKWATTEDQEIAKAVADVIAPDDGSEPTDDRAGDDG